VESEGLYRLVREHLPYQNLQDAKIPVHIVATDLVSGDAVILSEGPAAQAIVASTAIPAAFAPVQLDRLYLADGAITSCTPVHLAVALGSTRLIVLPTGTPLRARLRRKARSQMRYTRSRC
jgi:NTE family protein